MFRRIVVGSVATTGIAITAAYQLDERVRRPVIIWKELGPIIMHYRWVELKHKYFPPDTDELAAEAYNELHENYAGKVMSTLKDLRGFYIKVGQVLANRNDMLPDLYIEKLRQLEDQVPHALTAEQAKKTICDELKISKMEDVFQDFVDKPLGAASIGQVHKAKLKSNGQTVAIKLQDPDSERLFRMDIANSKGFCRVFAPEQVILFDELEKQFLTEFDYREEAKNLNEIKQNMASFKNVVVPQAFTDYCTKHVLTMEFLSGPKLIDGIRANGAKYAASIGKTFKELESEMKKDIEQNGMPPPYDGPSSFTLELYRNALRAKDAIINIPLFAANLLLYPIHRLTGLKAVKPFSYYESFIPLNSSYIMDTLLQAHGHQLLINGVFNADCHPGNFLLLPNGKIGMIDYGQVKRLNDYERLMLAKQVVAVANKDKEAIYKNNIETGYKSKYMDKEVMYNMAVIILDQDGRHITGGLNLQQYLDKQFATDPWEQASSLWIMPTRMSLLLRGVGLMMGHPVSVCTAWLGIAKKALKAAKIEI